MEQHPNRKSPRLQSFDYNSAGAYFVTLCTQNRQCILSRIVGTGVLEYPRIALTPYGEVAERYIRQLNSFYGYISVAHYVIMPNHIHMLVEIRGEGQSGTPVPTRANASLSQFISTFKRFCNKEYRKNIWQARFHDHIIRDSADYEKHARYIQENPTRWLEDALYVSSGV